MQESTLQIVECCVHCRELATLSGEGASLRNGELFLHGLVKSRCLDGFREKSKPVSVALSTLSDWAGHPEHPRRSCGATGLMSWDGEGNLC